MLPLYFFCLRMKNFGIRYAKMCWIPDEILRLIVNTLTRYSENEKQNIDRDMLFDMALRFNPEIIIDNCPAPSAGERMIRASPSR